MEKEPAPEESPSLTTESAKDEDTTPQQPSQDVAAPLEPEKQRTALQTTVLMFALCVSFFSPLLHLPLILTLIIGVCFSRCPRYHDRYHRPTYYILVLQDLCRLHMGGVGLHVV